MLVVKVVDEDIADKVDTKYISDQFMHVHDTDIIYICTREGGEEDDWVDESGIRQIVIHLPYKEVKRIADIRSLMLAKARERLGLVA
ncbi:MAG TPA: hypothetical protein PLY62_08830 [Bacteroidales bacterium]|nr:hypothetical protein [Saprospiraceae bacterium]HPH54144.1 hypothetical protein [Bacteroidales bacterium]